MLLKMYIILKKYLACEKEGNEAENRSTGNSTGFCPVS